MYIPFNSPPMHGWSKGRYVHTLPLIQFAKDCLLTGQEQACSTITRLVVRSFLFMPKIAEYTEKQLLTAPSTAKYSPLQPSAAQ